MMIALREEEVMKNRGYASTVSAAYAAFTRNFRDLFRFVWPFALVFAIGSWLTLFVFAAFWPSVVEGLTMGRWLLPFGMWLLVVGIAMLSKLFLYGRTTMMFNGKSLVWNMVRLLALMLCLLPVFILSLVTMGLLWVPVTYPAYQYIVKTKERFLSLFFKGYAIGLRHWGYLFLTQLLATLCAALVILVVSMPMIVLTMAQRVSLVGSMEGDPAGVPSYFGLLVGGVIVATAFVASFVIVFLMIVGYFMYGSVTTREEERNKSRYALQTDDQEA
jgi:hypothetical protein